MVVVDWWCGADAPSGGVDGVEKLSTAGEVECGNLARNRSASRFATGGNDREMWSIPEGSTGSHLLAGFGGWRIRVRAAVRLNEINGYKRKYIPRGR